MSTAPAARIWKRIISRLWKPGGGGVNQQQSRPLKGPELTLSLPGDMRVHGVQLPRINQACRSLPSPPLSPPNFAPPRPAFCAVWESADLWQAPESYDLWKVSAIVEASLVKKFHHLPPGVAQVLKGNASFIEEDGPMREMVLAASPLTKGELIENSGKGVAQLALKVQPVVLPPYYCHVE